MFYVCVNNPTGEVNKKADQFAKDRRI